MTKREKYPPEFREVAVKLVLEQGLSRSAAAVHFQGHAG